MNPTQLPCRLEHRVRGGLEPFPCRHETTLLWTGKVSCEVAQTVVASVSSGKATPSGQKTVKEQRKDDPQKKNRSIEAVGQSTSSSETPAGVKGSRAARKPISYPSSVESSGAGKGKVSAAMGLACKPAESTELEKDFRSARRATETGSCRTKARKGRGFWDRTAIHCSRTRHPNGSPQ